MKHFASPDFWFHYRKLPSFVQRNADKNYQLLNDNPQHPSLHFKKIREDLWSARVGLNYRALATREGGDYIWFWIGTHTDYDELIKT